MCPPGKFDLGDQHRLHPVAAFHDCRGNTQAPTPFRLLRQVDKGTRGASDLLQFVVKISQDFLGESGPDSASKQKDCALGLCSARLLSGSGQDCIDCAQRKSGAPRDFSRSDFGMTVQ
jgi:hypothetical protein